MGGEGVERERERERGGGMSEMRRGKDKETAYVLDTER